MRCPSCKITDDETWLAQFPKQVAADFSRFIDCNVIFSLQGVFRCYNCGAYFRAHEPSGEAEGLDHNRLQDLLDPTLCRGFDAVLSFPPDLLRVVTNELRLGNEAVGVCETDSGIKLVSLRYPFLDGHVVSSWIEYQQLPNDERWLAWYLCQCAHSAIACERRSHEQQAK